MRQGETSKPSSSPPPASTISGPSCSSQGGGSAQCWANVARCSANRRGDAMARSGARRRHHRAPRPAPPIARCSAGSHASISTREPRLDEFRGSEQTDRAFACAPSGRTKSGPMTSSRAGPIMGGRSACSAPSTGSRGEPRRSPSNVGSTRWMLSKSWPI